MSGVSDPSASAAGAREGRCPPPPGRPKVAGAPSGLSAAAPSLPAQAWTARRGAGSDRAAACKASATRAAVQRGGKCPPPPGRPKVAGAPSGGSATRAAVQRGGMFLGGFTLVEVLIALALLSLLMLVLSGALRAMGQVEERVDQRVEAADDYRLATQLLGDVLGRVSARRHAVLQAGSTAQAPFFEATPGALAWVGIMPARYGLGGRHYLRLALEPGAGGSQLVLRYAPWTGAATFSAWAQAQRLVLAAPATALTLSYLEPVSGQWSALWPPPGMPASALPASLLPAAVAIQVEGPEPAWPPLVIALVPTRTSDPSANMGSFGGSR